MTRKNIVILFGGCSTEYGVSLQSAAAVIEHISRDRYVPIPVGITREGDWYHFTGDTGKIPEDSWHNTEDCTPAMLSPSRSDRRLLVFRTNKTVAIPIDAVLPVLHGKNGEDGTVQGLCQLAGLPLVGCGTLASALAMDKHRAHQIAEAAGVAVPRSFTLEPGFDEAGAFSRAAEIGYPLFVKPVRSGSSIGITKVGQSDQLADAVSAAFAHDDTAIVEQSIQGFEVGCAVMGDREPVTGEVDEIELTNGFFDFVEKYNLVTSKIHLPARISAEKAAEIKRTAKIIYRALGCSGFARVDMFLTPEGEIIFNEVNTIPGFTAHSRFPSMMQAAGYSFEQVITYIIELAVKP